jgi:hypothetical protein
MPKMTAKEYAAHRGVSRTAVDKAIKAGRLKASVGKDGKGFLVIDSTQADREWDRNTDTSRAPLERMAPSKVKPPAARPEQPPAAPAPAVPRTRRKAGDLEVIETGLDEEQTVLAMKAAKLAEQTYRAELKRIEMETAIGQLVPIDQVKATVAAEYASVRQRLLGIPARYAQELALTDDLAAVRALLERAVNDALADLAADAGAGEEQEPDE